MEVGVKCVLQFQESEDPGQMKHLYAARETYKS